MLSCKVSKFLLTFAGVFLVVSDQSCVSSFHVDLSTNPVIIGSNLGESDNSSSNSNATSAKGSIASLTSLPNQLTNQIQSIIQPLLNQFNSTKINSTISSLLGTVRNLTNSLGNIKQKGSFRVENLIHNVTEVLRNSKNSLEQNSTSVEEAQNGIQNVLIDFERKLLGENFTNEVEPLAQEAERRSGNETGWRRRENDRNSRKINELRRMWDQMTTFRAQMDQSLLNARSRLEDTMNSITRQGVAGNMRNQTVGFMGEVQRVFTVFTEPFTQFLQNMRRRLPTSVVQSK